MAWLWWLGGAILLGVVELLTLDLIFLMLAAGAVLAAAAAAAGAPWWACVIVFCVISVLMLAVVRPWALTHLKVHGRGRAVTGAQAAVGQPAVALTAIGPGGGKAKLNGEVWTARTQPGTPPVQPGQTVAVTAIDGATAVIVPIATPGPAAPYQPPNVSPAPPFTTPAA
ncbi:MAG: NfeD family protein [Bifidobacteriaceae bacterium]|jgi:membrane protein implicated in regulation of membrane protease activity|nr:NfeD family protein [Bifidobacteriaceae bacterium]